MQFFGLITALLLLVIGAGEIVYAVFQLAGHGWGMAALGCFTMGFGAIAARGLS